LRRRYSVTAADICLLRICWLAADVSLFVSRSLPSNGYTQYVCVCLGLWKQIPIDQRSWRKISLLECDVDLHENVGSVFHRNIGIYLSNNTSSYFRRHKF
jgi:hypothetical protein